MPRDVSANEFDPLRQYVRVLWQQGRVAVDADSNEDKYVHLRRSLFDLAESLDRNLGWGVFEPSRQPPPAAKRRAREPRWTDAGEHDPGVTLVDVLAYAADALGARADEVAAEAELRSKRRRAAAVAVVLVLFAWRARRRR
jgi:hypothetical protein